MHSEAQSGDDWGSHLYNKWKQNVLTKGKQKEERE